MADLPADEIERIVRRALVEDVGGGDVTSIALVPSDATAEAALVAREPLIAAGLSVAEAVFRAVSPDIKTDLLVSDSAEVGRDRILLRVSGPTQLILTAERVALNFVQRLSGIATLTRQYVQTVAGTGAAIYDTRKTTPGLRVLEKYAVRCGGGVNHRSGLYDMILIKDNHLAALAHEKPNAIAVAVQRARARYPQLRVEVEADDLGQVEQAVAARADIVLLDNMTPALLKTAVALVAGRIKTEASGGVNLSTVRAIAQTGVDYISIGALTHSARAVDVALDFGRRA